MNLSAENPQYNLDCAIRLLNRSTQREERGRYGEADIDRIRAGRILQHIGPEKLQIDPWVADDCHWWQRLFARRQPLRVSSAVDRLLRNGAGGARTVAATALGVLGRSERPAADQR